jgi:hypothetical protein
MMGPESGATPDVAPPTGPTPSGRRRRLDRSLNGILLALALEFFLGMWLNLFGAFSTGYPSLADSASNPTGLILVIHTVVGILLLVGGLGILLNGFRQPIPTIRWLAVVGLVGTVMAGLAGSSFVQSGFADPYASFAMAVGFAVALTGYYEALVTLRGNPPAPASSAPIPRSSS